MCLFACLLDCLLACLFVFACEFVLGVVVAWLFVVVCCLFVI